MSFPPEGLEAFGNYEFVIRPGFHLLHPRFGDYDTRKSESPEEFRQVHLESLGHFSMFTSETLRTPRSIPL